MKVNSQYNVAAPKSLPVRIATYQRRRMYEKFLQSVQVGETDSILDIGVTSDQTYESSNYLEAWYPHKDKITAAGIDDASFLEEKYPGVRFVTANGLDLPFDDRSFDFVHSSAVLEHVGSFENQTRFVRECTRVARKGVFLTTPNRWFPIEFHTLVPFAHWLPKPWFRAILRKVGLEFFSDEANLNLLSHGELVSATSDVDDFDFLIFAVALAGWPSNLCVAGLRKDGAKSGQMRH